VFVQHTSVCFVRVCAAAETRRKKKKAAKREREVREREMMS
jgi:hypothetical protein